MDRPHLLIVEDDVSVSELLFSCLSKANYRVSVAPTGEAGLQLIEEDPPDALVLDLTLPGMNGLDVCRTMRRDLWMGKIPILMLTGKAEEDDIVAGLEVGADDYMTKPFSPKLLTARVKALLRRGNSLDAVDTPESSAEKQTVEPLIIKTLGRCEITNGARRFSWAEDFSPAQRQLMAMLVGSPSGKVHQEEIQVALWPDSSSSRARSSFDSLMSRVRRTLDQLLEPFDSKKYLLVKRGYLCLENCRVDAHEFIRFVRKGTQQVATGDLWPAEISFSSAFSFWHGTFIPADFGSDAPIFFQDELEQLYLEASQTFARVLAENGRYQEAVKVLRHAQRYGPSNDELIRLLYQLCLAQGHPGQASQVLRQYCEILEREKYSTEDISDVLGTFPQKIPEKGWLKG